MYVELRLCCLQVPDSCLPSLRIRLLAWKTPTFRSLIKPRCGKHDDIPELVGFCKLPQCAASRTFQDFQTWDEIPGAGAVQRRRRMTRGLEAKRV